MATTSSTGAVRARTTPRTGATLDDEQLKRFDDEHDALLASLAGDHFTIRHRVDAHVLVRR